MHGKRTRRMRTETAADVATVYVAYTSYCAPAQCSVALQTTTKLRITLSRYVRLTAFMCVYLLRYFFLILNRF